MISVEGIWMTGDLDGRETFHISLSRHLSLNFETAACIAFSIKTISLAKMYIPSLYVPMYKSYL